jgi:hypothetical protein
MVDGRRRSLYGRCMRAASRPRREPTRSLVVRVDASTKADIRELPAVHGLTVSEYVRQTALGRLRPGVDRFAELERRMEAVEQLVRQVPRGY